MSGALVAIGATLVGVSFTSVIALMAWMVQTLSRTSGMLAVMEERSEDHERRITLLEQAI